MARVFENPANGHREEVSDLTWLFALLFGCFYFAAKALWTHVLIQVALIIVFLAAFGPPGTMFAIGMWVVYAFAASGILASSYLRRGWKDVGANDVSSDSTAGPAAGAALIPNSVARPAADERACPFCAETIKKAAIKCRHCGSTVEAMT